MGSDRIVSMVPFSYSGDDQRGHHGADDHDDDGHDAGMMKFRLSRSSLNQTRMRPSTGALIFPGPGD